MASIALKKFKRVLVANRGEIALRIIRTLREMGIESVAIYSDTDRASLHVSLADHAYCIGGNLPSESYLVIDKICEAIKATGAEAVHPGFGFLSENADFAAAVAKAGAEFIGPPPSAMIAMGDKIMARETMKKNNVPVVPGADHPLVSVAELKQLAKGIGFPIILKAAAGGGGRGMRVVRKEEDLGDAFEACTREAKAYFGNPAVFCERYVDNPRHIEFQVLFDKHGNGVHLHERDCSIQRRHQKLLEEAPSAYLNETQRQRMGEIAVLAGKAVGYVGAGTIEFICESPDKFYFMEMNTRIQVEHPVTEMITGVDLIKEMVLVAEGNPLPFTQKDVPLRGWAIETRINAEDPTQGFMPQPGVVRNLRMPQGPNVRVESHLYSGYEIPASYDSMVAKIITWGHDRREAIARMQRALAELQVDGVPTTAKFQEALLRHPLFVKADIHTQMIERHWEEFMTLMQESDDSAVHYGALLAAVLSESALNAGGKQPPPRQPMTAKFGRSAHASNPQEPGEVTMHWNVKIGSKEVVVNLPDGVTAGAKFRADIEGKSYLVSYDGTRGALTLSSSADGGTAKVRSEDWIHVRRGAVLRTEGDIERQVDMEFGGAGLSRTFTLKAQAHPFIPGITQAARQSSHKAQSLRSPMAGKLLRVLVTVGQRVEPGQPLVIVEAMKMENKILATAPVTIGTIKVQEGAAVAVNQELIRFDQG